MRNLKAKGFTLVELIVVIAIIGVLAAVLVPAMMGYMRDSRISQANSNANAVYKAAQAALTKHCSANGTAGMGGAVLAPTTVALGSAPGTSVTVGTATFNGFGDRLGAQFVGTYGFTVDSTGEGIDHALWSTQDATLTRPATQAAQEQAYNSNQLVGVFPIPTT